MNNIRMIQSSDNSLFKNLIKLSQSARQRRKQNQTIIEGTHLLSAWLASGLKPQIVCFKPHAEHNAEIQALLPQLTDCQLICLEENLFDQISELKTPTPVLALVDIPQQPPTQKQFVLLLEDIQDPGNMGSILRSAAAAGCDAVYLSQHCVDAWSPKVLRAAMGGHTQLAIYEHQDLSSVAHNFTGTLFATTLQTNQSLYQARLTGAIGFMFGNEGSGLSESLLQHAKQHIKIPMPGQVESLNVAAASAICLFEAVRQRQ